MPYSVAARLTVLFVNLSAEAGTCFAGSARASTRRPQPEFA